MFISTVRKMTCSILLLTFELSTNMLSAAPPAEALPKNAVVLTTKTMCCAKESVPAIKELRKIPGVERVVANYQTRSLTIYPKEGVYPSLRAMWEAAERVQIEPTHITTTQFVLDKKPLR